MDRSIKSKNLCLEQTFLDASDTCSYQKLYGFFYEDSSSISPKGLERTFKGLLFSKEKSSENPKGVKKRKGIKGNALNSFHALFTLAFRSSPANLILINSFK